MSAKNDEAKFYCLRNFTSKVFSLMNLISNKEYEPP